MYLTYLEYNLMGGTLDETAFLPLARKAQAMIDSQVCGRCQERIAALPELPQAVRDCVFDLIEHLSANKTDGTAVKSESQSLGGQSESCTYATLTKEESDAELDNIIFRYLSLIRLHGVSILYRGACV